MPLTSAEYRSLFNRLLEGELSPEEAEIIVAWLGSKEPDAEAAGLILKQLEGSVDEKQMRELIPKLESKLPEIIGESGKKQGSLFFPGVVWLRYAVAAAVLFLVALAWFWGSEKSNANSPQTIASIDHITDVQPGKDGAVLTLADGTQVVLDTLNDGMIAAGSGASFKLSKGRLAYGVSSNPYNSDPGADFHTLSTPKGRQFSLQLPDGTKVWLNAASSIKFPAAFDKNVRKVEITGEAYFEVAAAFKPSNLSSAIRNAERVPFIVNTRNQTIEVLGTHFNVNTYEDEVYEKTTLIEGSVRVLRSGTQQALMLTPGQQALVGTDQTFKQFSVETEKVIAWKNGLFNFQDASLEEVMNQLKRWYDIDVEYEEGIPELEFVGKMGRDLSLANVLRGLEMSKVKFRLEENGKKLVVLP